MLSNNFFIYDEKLIKFYHDLDIINVNNITISIFVKMLCIVEIVPGPYYKQCLNNQYNNSFDWLNNDN